MRFAQSLAVIVAVVVNRSEACLARAWRPCRGWEPTPFIMLPAISELSSGSPRVILVAPTMRVCLLTTQDLDVEPFPADDWPCDPRPFLPEADWRVVPLRKNDSVGKVTALVQGGEFDLFFNLCDGAADEDSPGIEVVKTLERLGVPFTGATSEYYEPTREEMKAGCRRAGIATPSHVLARLPSLADRPSPV